MQRRENNFTLIRLTASIFVFAGHMAVMMGMEPPKFANVALHELGVAMLFLVSGYLITKSWMSDSDPLRYIIRRFLRLWPAYAVMILIMVYITGPLLSELGREGYFQSYYSTYLKNLRFYIIYIQPGVFTDTPIPNVTNGSLWTMPVEAAIYIVTPIIVAICRTKSSSKRSLTFLGFLTMAAIIFDLYLKIYHPDSLVVIYATHAIAAYHLFVYFLIGMLYTYPQVMKLLNLQVACVGMIVLLIAQNANTGLHQLLVFMVVPYFAFSLIFTPKPAFSKLDRLPEISYGIYLYGYFFQQLTISTFSHKGWSLTYLQAFTISIIPTLIAALLSCILIERPMMKLSRYITEKLKKVGS